MKIKKIKRKKQKKKKKKGLTISASKENINKHDNLYDFTYTVYFATFFFYFIFLISHYRNEHHKTSLKHSKRTK